MQKKLDAHIEMDFEVERMQPLFSSEADYNEFKNRHAKHQVPVGDLASYRGNAYLGIDAGSTTTKAALVGEDGTMAMTVILLVRPSVRSRIFTASFRKAYRSFTPAQPVTEKRSLKPHFFWMKAKLKPYLTITPLLSSNRM